MKTYQVEMTAKYVVAIEAETEGDAEAQAVNDLSEDPWAMTENATIDDVREGLLCVGCEEFLPIYGPYDTPTGVCDSCTSKAFAEAG